MVVVFVVCTLTYRSIRIEHMIGSVILLNWMFFLYFFSSCKRNVMQRDVTYFRHSLHLVSHICSTQSWYFGHKYAYFANGMCFLRIVINLISNKQPVSFDIIICGMVESSVKGRPNILITIFFSFSCRISMNAHLFYVDICSCYSSHYSRWEFHDALTSLQILLQFMQSALRNKDSLLSLP